MAKKGFRRYASAVLLLLMAAGAVAAGSSVQLQWSQQVMPVPPLGIAHMVFTQVIHAGGRYVAVGGEAVNGIFLSGTIMESTDGITWKTVFQDSTGNIAVQTVAYGNGVYVATGTYEPPSDVAPVGSWLTSTDGVNWTVEQTDYSAPLTDVVFGNGEFAVFVSACDAFSGNCESDQIITSTDGISWNAHRAPIPDDSLGFADGEFLDLSRSDGDHVTAYSSNDAVVWNATSTFASRVRFTRIRATGDTVSAVGLDDEPVVAISEDGRNWTANQLSLSDDSFNSGNFRDIARFGNTYLATFTNGELFFGDTPDPGTRYPLAMSNNGKTWCNLKGYPSADPGLSLAVNGGQIVTVGDGGAIFSTAPSTAPDVSLTCAGAPFVNDVSVGVPPVSGGSGGKGDFSLIAVCGLLGIVLRRRGGARHPPYRPTHQELLRSV